MKKSVKVVLTTVSALGLFAVGFGSQQIVSHANSTWQTIAESNASSQLWGSAQAKTNALSQNVDNDINQAVQDKLSSEVAQQQDDLQNLLQQYYQDKINGLTNSDEYKQLESQITSLKGQLLSQYESQIDKMFVGK